MSADGRCHTCWFSDWRLGGYCLRPSAGFKARQVVEPKDLHRYPAVKRLDFCGDNTTLMQFKRRANQTAANMEDLEDLPIPDMVLDGTILATLQKRKELL